jgi:hypothetical protein
MTSRRPRPEIYATWLSKLIVGDYSCEWSVWFKSNHLYRKLPSDFDSTGHKIKHTALLNHARAMLESQGKMISTESQNWFEIKGKVATLRGKPDLVALSDTCVICDAKTGQERASDAAQVMIYMWALPYAYTKYKGIAFDGLLIYRERELRVPASSVTDEFKDNLLNLIKRVGSSVEARRIPSYAECKYCDISKEDCADRIEEDEQPGSVMTDLF